MELFIWISFTLTKRLCFHFLLLVGGDVLTRDNPSKEIDTWKGKCKVIRISHALEEAASTIYKEDLVYLKNLPK